MPAAFIASQGAGDGEERLAVLPVEKTHVTCVLEQQRQTSHAGVGCSTGLFVQGALLSVLGSDVS